MGEAKKCGEHMIVIKSNITNSILIEVETEGEAENIVELWEDIDRMDGTYTPNAYRIEVVW